MRKFTLQLIAFLLLFLCASVNLHAQLGSNQWKFSNPKPFGFWSWQMSYADDNTALVVGESGGIAKTTDGGATWAYFAYTTTNGAGELLRPGFNDVQFVNSSLAYIVGDDGVMIKSIDGGINWSFVTTPFYSVTNREYNKIHTVCFLDANTGYIGGDGDSATNQATIYKTTNGGATWQPEFQFPAPAQSWFYAAIYKIRFSPSGIGYAGGANGLVWKYNSGVWSNYSITDSTIYPNVNAADTSLVQWGPEPTDTFTQIATYSDNIWGLDDQNYRAIAIINDTAIVVGTQNNGGLIRINTATPAGSYWMINNGSALNSRYAPLNSPQIYNAICRNGSNIAATSSEGRILLSADKGYTWNAKNVYVPGTDEAANGFYGIDIAPSGRIGLCGEAGVVADSTNQWRKPYVLVQPNGSLRKVQFINANYGIAAGTGGAMMRTNDGGANWEDISNPTFNPWDSYNSIVYLSPDVLLASASNAQLYKSVDRGTSFDLLYSQPESASLDAIHFINEDTGWMLANVRYPDMVNYIDTFHQFIYRTTDGGFTWDTSNTVFPYSIGYSERRQIREIKFLNAAIGYAAGDSGSLYKSTDGGLNWVKQLVPAYVSSKTLNSIAIVDENTVFVSGERNFWINEGAAVLKTLNGGSTWTMCNTGLQPTASYSKILMYNASERLVFGNAVVYATKNGGASWVPYYTPTSGFAGEFEGASFAPIAGCATGICQKAFAVAGRNIFKLDADVVLPVKFSNLTGAGTTEGNQLFWTAFAQESVSYFEIERSVDGVGFQKIADKVYPGSFNYQSYQWLDLTAAAGRNYYRIKATERSGAVYYTNIVMIASKKAAKWNYIVNSDNLILNNVKVQPGNVTAMLVNTAGQTVSAKSWDQNGGAFNQVLLLPAAAKGVYVVKVDNEGAVYSFRIFIQ
ncbi:MAG: T9SS type A sorting domain-containing protein [Chitinophagaceae bacterium]|nr:T9SS type A sorting domain-containing protein [Chitinophagaceae bacterium]